MKAKRILAACLPGLLAILFVITLHGTASALDQFYVDSTASFSATADTSYDVEAGDVDGDGDLDIFVANNGPNRLYINDGSGGLVDESVRIPVDSDASIDVSFGDVDNDGDLDIFIANTTQNRLYLNDGTGVFTDATSTNMPALSYVSLAGDFGDVDNDGDLDIIVVNNNAQNRLYLNDGFGGFTDGTSGRLPVEAFADCDGDFGDLDGDGDLDLAIGNCDSGSSPEASRLLINDGTGVFTDETATIAPDMLTILDVTAEIELGVSDVDGDGDLDILMANQGAKQNRILINQGFDQGGTEGYFVEETSTRLPSINDTTRDMDLGDVDNDGDLDIIVANFGGEQNRLLINNGSGVFSDQTASRMPVDTDESFEADFADVDGDGDLDIIIANTSNQQNRILINDGTGNFSIQPFTLSLPVDSDASIDASFGDVDGDGDLDIFIANTTQNRLYLNDGTGVFTDATSTNMPALSYVSLAGDFGDVDNDGDLDIIVVNNNAQNRLYLNDGFGGFTDGTSGRLPVEAFADCDGDFGDLDGDGDLDLAIGNCDSGSSPEASRLLINDGTGVFTDETATIAPDMLTILDVTAEIEIGVSDVDGDGDLDILMANQGAMQNRILINQGFAQGGTEGYFVEETSTRLPGISDTTRDMDLGDVDNDGDLDIIVANFNGEQNRILINNGSGVFSDQTASRMPVNTDESFEADFADVDNDGDLDIIIANTSNQQNRLLINDGTGNYTDETAARLPFDSDTSYDMEFGDVDGDGDLDVFVANAGQNRLYLNISISPNTAPVLAGIGNQALGEDTSTNVPLSATDADAGDTITLTGTNLPAFASLADNGNGTGTLTISPVNGDAGGYAGVVITACDDAASPLCDSETITITVTATNYAPTAVDDSASTSEDTPVTTGNVLTNDTDPDAGDTLSVLAVDTVSVNGGAVVDNGDGTFTYTPALNFNGTDTFTYTVSDGNGGTDVGTVTITVTAVNDPPVANPDPSESTTEDTPVTTGNVLTNDTDVDGGDTLSVSGADTVSANGGTVVDNGDGTFTYTPPLNFNGTDTFTYTVSDGNGGTDVGTVTITVTAVNDAPVAVGDTAVTNQDTAVTTGNVLTNDTDADGDTLSVSGADTVSANGGTVVDNGDGTFTYTPAAGFSGTDTFTYTVSDGNGGTDVGTVTITVNPVVVANSAPTADAGSDQLVTMGYGVNLSGSGSSDPEDDPLTYSWTFTSIPAGSSAVLSGETTVYPTFTADLTGTYTVQLTVSDGALSSSDTVTVTVLGSEFEVKITPTTLNLGTEGQPLSVFVQLPLEYPVADVDPEKLSLFMVFYGCTVAPCTVTADLSTYNVNTTKNKFSIKFPRSDVEALLNANNAWGQDITIRVQGGFYNGTPNESVTLYGDDIVRVNQ